MVYDMNLIWLFLIILPIIAFLYASVGHGGASGYLALMALFSFTPETMKPTALLLNLFVAGIAFYHYYKAGYFNKNLFIPFAISSIPLAFIGGTIELESTIYKIILGVLLIVAIFKMLNVFGNNSNDIKDIKLWQGLITGGIIGFLSGLIGIGGGIILTPIIVLFHWGHMKEAAAVSALFIWVNSAAGLIGQITNGAEITNQAIIFVIIAMIGGFAGSYYGSKKFNNKLLRHLLAFVLIIASVKLIFVI